MKHSTAERLIIFICTIASLACLLLLMGACVAVEPLDLPPTVAQAENEKAERFWCERSNGTYNDGSCSLGENY